MVEYGMMHGWGMGFFWLFPLGLVLLFVYLVNGKRSPSAKDILDRRYARGEIDTKEYRERLRELGYPHEDDDDQ